MAFAPAQVLAGCTSTRGPCFGSGSCTVSGNVAKDCSGCSGVPASENCPGTVWSCDTGPEAKGICGGAAQSCQNGTCDSTSCGWNGNGNCNDFGWHDGCDAAPAGCYWDSLGQSGWNEGVCKGRYCIVDNSPGNGCYSFNNNKGLCQGSGCNWTQGPDNTCADACSLNGAACGQMQCHDSCTGGLVYGTCPVVTCQHYACSGTACTAVAGQGANSCSTGNITWPGTVTPYPASGATNVSVNPILTWTNVSSWGDSCATTHTYNLYLKKQGAASYTMTNLVGNSSAQNLEHDTTYQWYVVPQNNNGTGPQAPAASPFYWTFTTVPQSWFQVTGGDVYGKVVTSLIPSTCTSNCYINLAN